MYAAHFGLQEPPFGLTPDPRYIYMSERHQEALAHLLWGIGHGGGFVQLTGAVGTGKTTMCRCLLEQLPPDVDLALIFNPRLSSLELLAAVCDELGVAYPPETASVKVLVDALHRHLLDAHARGRRTVLVIDEAQNLAPEVLEQVRLLTNLETARDKLLHIVLIGQPELVGLLDRDELRQLAQRVTARYHLQPLTREETRAYVQHRLAVAGQARPIFTAAALDEVHGWSRGVPRLINIICDRALLGAWAEGRSRVDVRTVRRGAREVRGAPTRRRHPWRWTAVGAGLLAALALLTVGARLGGLTHLRATLLSALPLAAATSVTVPADAPRTAEDSAARGEPVAPVTVENALADGAPALDSPAASPTLESVLAAPDLPSDRRHAFVTLYARWGLRYSGDDRGPGCEFGRAAGLRCFAGTGTWGRLRRLDLPAILELRTALGAVHFATLEALGEQRATVAFGERRSTFPLHEIERHWTGAFVILWSAPAGRLPLVPGQRGPVVEWLRRGLGAANGGSAPAEDQADFYDTRLVSQVKGFQASQLLPADGIVGEETLAHLSATLRQGNMPTLGRP
jgi:general secretion pathway protein A